MQDTSTEGPADLSLPKRRITVLRVVLHLLFWVWNFHTVYIACDRNLRVTPTTPPDSSLMLIMMGGYVATTLLIAYTFGYFVLPRLMLLSMSLSIDPATGETSQDSIVLLKNVWRHFLKIGLMVAAIVAVFTFFNVYDYYLFQYFNATFDPKPAFITRGYTLLSQVGPFGSLTHYGVTIYIWSLNISYVLLALLLMMIRLGLAWGLELRRQKRLNREIFDNQIQRLHQQISPHFIFNVFNNIQAMIHQTNAGAASLLSKLSGLMRYSLYETQETLVPLVGEVRYIENYLAIERTRHFNEEAITLDRTGDIEGYLVPPLLLITFIENGIKHGITNSFGDGWLKIRLIINAGQLCFEVANSVHPNEEVSDVAFGERVGGIGLRNAKKRLALMYPTQNYSLQIEQQPSSYRVKLLLPLVRQKTPSYQSIN